MTETICAMLAALALDLLLGEPRRFHPLIGFGRMAAWLEARLNPQGRGSVMAGALALALLVIPPLAALALALFLAIHLAAPWLAFALETLTLWFTLGARSLFEHGRRLERALAAGDLPSARRFAGMMVSRETGEMKGEELARAGIESLLENGNDAIFAPLFWFALLGAPAALAFRLVNTLDAMWGYRTARFLRFGRAAARLDDALNFIPARLTALSYALAGRFGPARRCWLEQGKSWESPNAGPVMAAGAGALMLRLGGPAPYHGEMRQRPVLGAGAPPGPADMARARTLLLRSLLAWMLALAMAAAIIFMLLIIAGGKVNG
jgi:adenosylcobinamide-phosphate synthase